MSFKNINHLLKADASQSGVRHHQVDLNHHHVTAAARSMPLVAQSSLSRDPGVRLYNLLLLSG